MSLSLIVEESDATVVTASDEGWGSGRVGETTDGGQVTCTQRNKRSSEHVQETNLPTFSLVAWGKTTINCCWCFGLVAPFPTHTYYSPTHTHLSPEVCTAVLFLCPNRAPPAVAVWLHPSTLEEESEPLITLPLSILSKLYTSY